MQRYLKVLQQVFITFEVSPYSKKIHRAVKKEKKIYFFNHIAVIEPGARFENMIALLLSKWCSSARERALGHYELHYIRDQDRREVDFLVTLEGVPELLVEAKLSDTNFTRPSLHFHHKLKVPILHIVRKPGIQIEREEGVVTSIHSLARLLG